MKQALKVREEIKVLGQIKLETLFKGVGIQQIQSYVDFFFNEEQVNLMS